MNLEDKILNVKKNVTVVESHGKFYAVLPLPTGLNQKEFDNKYDAERFASEVENLLSTLIYNTTKTLFFRI